MDGWVDAYIVVQKGGDLRWQIIVLWQEHRVRNAAQIGCKLLCACARERERERERMRECKKEGRWMDGWILKQRTGLGQINQLY